MITVYILKYYTFCLWFARKNIRRKIITAQKQSPFISNFDNCQKHPLKRDPQNKYTIPLNITLPTFIKP